MVFDKKCARRRRSHCHLYIHNYQNTVKINIFPYYLKICMRKSPNLPQLEKWWYISRKSIRSQTPHHRLRRYIALHGGRGWVNQKSRLRRYIALHGGRGGAAEMFISHGRDLYCFFLSPPAATFPPKKTLCSGRRNIFLCSTVLYLRSQ